ncbi:MAG: tol-pal system protein YbgF [Desulfobacterales bacterium]|nr:tol-pal system protein YbgF [Desulfobacterales bacterium]
MRAKMVAPWVVLAITAVISFGGCAHKDDLMALNDYVIALEQRVSSQNKEANTDRALLRSELTRYHEDCLKSDQALRNRHADLHAVINDLRDEMRHLRGDLEKGQYDSQKGIGDLAASEAKREANWRCLEKSFQNYIDRIVRIEQYLGMEPSEKLVALDTDQDESVEGKLEVQETPEGLYARAKQLFDNGEYENARELFRSFLKDYPKSKMGDNAQFWLGEIYYRDKWYEKAILEYQKVIESYPKGNKTPSALLKQGFAFSNLGDEANARLILRELIRKFPNSNEANVAKKKLKTLK